MRFKIKKRNKSGVKYSNVFSSPFPETVLHVLKMTVTFRISFKYYFHLFPSITLIFVFSLASAVNVAFSYFAFASLFLLDRRKSVVCKKNKWNPLITHYLK